MFSARFSLLFAALLALGALAAAPLKAQLSVKATPYSFRATLDEAVPTYTLPAKDLPAPALQLPIQDQFGFFLVPPAQLGLEADVDFGFDNAGRWQHLPDGGRLWRARIASEGASALHLIYDDFWMPEGAQLFLYNDDHSVVLGAFTERNNKDYGSFSTDFVPGEATTLEYYEPAGGTEPGRLHVATLLHGTEQSAAKSGASAGTALPCAINVECPEGSGWGTEIKSVVKISNGCTGVLINNVEEDETPYVLTVNHCGWPSVGQTVNWVFSFNSQTDTCSGPDGSYTGTISGATVVAASSAYDFTLLELSEGIPEEFDAYFAGWSIQDDDPSSGVVIGHPKSDYKKITVEDDPIWTSPQSSNILVALFDHGTIETGSSGSPLFDENGDLVGILKASYNLDPVACSGPGGDDNAPQIQFMKLPAIWNVGAAGSRISDFLDPGNTGTSSMPPAPATGANLPVELVSFDAQLDGQAAELRWETASETNNAGFEIQQFSTDGAATWEALGWVEGHGTTLEAQTYSYRVDFLAAGTYRFRLKQIDFDGTFEYSPEVEVAVGIPSAYHLSPAYPNPFNPETQFSLSVAQAQQVQVAVYDIMGRRVAMLYDGLIEAQTTRAMMFEAESLPSGLYLIRVLGERFVTSQTVTLVK